MRVVLETDFGVKVAALRNLPRKLVLDYIGKRM
jgi:hypothetical protein